MKNIIITFLLVSIASCKSRSQPSLGLNPDSMAIKTVQGFYSWYINDAYPMSTSFYQVPGYKQLSSISYIFDLQEYKKRLNMIEYFSESYKEKLTDRLKSCNEDMIKFKWDYEPEPMFNIDACNYLWGNQWVGGQGEKISGYQIVSVESKMNAAVCKVNILIGKSVFVQSVVNLVKVGEEYKISDLSLNWKRE